MVSNEVEQTRGCDDAQIAAFIADHSGVPIDAGMVTCPYAEPDERANS